MGRPSIAENILNLLKRAVRDKSSVLQYNAIVFLFKLLEGFANNRSPIAAIIYKILTFSLIENHSNITLRSLVLKNFENVMENFPSIPLDVILDPLLKQIIEGENKSYFLNTFDIEFFLAVSEHPKLDMKLAFQILDIFNKIYLNNIVFSSKIYYIFL